MSKEKPEVGDVWEYKGERMVVIGVRGFIHPICIKKDRKEFETAWLFMFDYSDYTYLGKSKAKISDLFEVQDD